MSIVDGSGLPVPFIWRALDAVRRVFVERPDSNPLPFLPAKILRLATVVVIIVATDAALYHGLVLRPQTANVDLAELVGISLVTLFQLAYLWLVFWLLIFSQPLEKLYLQRAWIPGLLVLAYLVFAEYAKVHNQFGGIGRDRGVKVVANVVFFVLYTIWLARDVSLYFDTRSPVDRVDPALWIPIELVIISVLVLQITMPQWPQLTDWLPPVISMVQKEQIITLCTMVWPVARWLHYVSLDGAYHRTYLAYMANANVLDIRAVGTLDLTKIDAQRCFDFGCGDGTRTVETLRMLGMRDTSPVVVVGFDKNESWRPHYLETVLKSFAAGVASDQVKFITKLEDSPFAAPQYDLIILAHVVYEQWTLRKIIAFLAQCREGAYVVVRGSSPRSIFISVSRAFCSRLWRPPMTHLWYTHALARLQKMASLDRLSGTDAVHVPDIEIKQEYKLTNGGPETLSDFLRHLYGDRAGTLAKEHLRVLRDDGNVVSIPNDDWVYLFRVRRNTAKDSTAGQAESRSPDGQPDAPNSAERLQSVAPC